MIMKKDMSIKQSLNVKGKRKKLQEAIVWAEILSKPKALRRKGTNRLV